MSAEKNIYRHMVDKGPYDVALEDYDVSQRELFQNMTYDGFFERLRNEDPIHYCKDSKFGPYWSITRFEDLVDAERATDIFSAEPTISIQDFGGEVDLPPMFIAMDEPKHGEQRRSVQGVVAPQNLAQLEATIRERVEGILDSLPIGESFNWVDRVSIELTGQMLATIMGFPFEDRRKLTYWSDVATAVPGSHPDCIVSSYQETADILINQMVPTFIEMFEYRKKKPGQFDVISMLANTEATKNMVQDNLMEFLGNLILLIVGGNDTTRNSISGSVYFLNKFPAEYEKLKDDLSLIPSLVSETIRYQTPLTHMCRRVKKNTVFKGKELKKGDKVVLWYVSGNRDSSAIERADEFIIDRKNPRHHISFGFGIHRCMGNRLAEMQLRIVWEEIMKRFERVEVLSEPKRPYSNLVKGYSEMQVKLHG